MIWVNTIILFEHVCKNFPLPFYVFLRNYLSLGTSKYRISMCKDFRKREGMGIALQSPLSLPNSKENKQKQCFVSPITISVLVNSLCIIWAICLNPKKLMVQKSDQSKWTTFICNGPDFDERMILLTIPF